MSVRLSDNIFRRACAGLLALAVIALARGAAAPASAPATPGTAYVTGFRLQGFGDDGFKTWEIQGREAQAAAGNTSLVQITEMTLIRYSGGPALSIESTIQCSHATVRTDKDKNQTTVSSPEKLYIFDGANNSYQATGNDWTWDGNAAQATPTAVLNPDLNRPVIHIGKSVYVKFTAAAAAAGKASPPPTAAAPAQPVTITSDTLDIYQLETDNRFVFTGNIVVTDGECRTSCQWLEVLAQRSAAPNPATPAAVRTAAPVSLGVGHLEHIVAKDGVTVRQGDLEASGGMAETAPGEQRVILTEGPQIHAQASDTRLQGGRIVWQRDTQVMQVEPAAGTPTAPGRVSVSLPPLASYQKDAEPPVSDGQRLVITGESLVAQFGDKQRFDVEKSVRVVDPSLTVNAQHLDAEFAAKTDQTPATVPATPPANANTVPQMGKLDHLTVSGGVTIYQEKLTTTTPKAEILPAAKQVVFNDGAHIVDGKSHAEIDGGRLLLSTDGQSGLVESTPGRPVNLQLPPLPGLAQIAGPNSGLANTTVTSDTVAMQRLADNSTFTFDKNVHITANDLDSTCAELVVTTNNLAANPGDDPLAGPAKIGQISELEERGQVVVSQGDYQARGARADIYPQTKITPDAAANASAPTQPYRLVQLSGDPTGATGPVRPEVVVPLKPGTNLTATSGNTDGNATASTAANSTAKITSDQQWLMSSPAGNTYYFEDHVQIVTDTYTATCDRMRAEGSPTKNAEPAGNADPAKPAPKVSLERIIAESNVTIRQGTGITTAGRAEILPGEHTATLSDNVLVVNDRETLKNANIILHLDTGKAEAVKPPETPGQPVKRPTVVISGATTNFDKLLKPSDKPAAGTSP